MTNAQQQKVTIAVSADSYPFHFSSIEGQPSGLFIDQWRLWAKKRGKEIELIIASWPDTLSIVKDGRADILPYTVVDRDSSDPHADTNKVTSALTSELLTEFPQLFKILHSHVDEAERLKSVMLITEIKEFANHVEQLASEHRCSPLVTRAEKTSHASVNFEIDLINRKMSEFITAFKVQ